MIKEEYAVKKLKKIDLKYLKVVYYILCLTGKDMAEKYELHH